MNIFNKLRSPYSAMFFASLMLFISCEQHTSEVSQSFDNNIFNTYKNSNHLNNVLNNMNSKGKKSSKTSVLQTNKLILSSVNEELGTNVSLPDAALAMSVDMEANYIYDTALNNGWLNAKDVELSKEFSIDVETKGFNSAIKNYQDKVLTLNLSDDEFAKKNVFLNTVNTLDYENPGLFSANTNTQSKGWYRCALASVALAATTAGLTSCVTIAACALAVLLQVNAVYAFNDHCLS